MRKTIQAGVFWSHILLVVVLVGCRSGSWKSSSSTSMGPNNNLPNFAKVSDTLYRGGQPTPEGFGQLKKMGVNTVISLRLFKTDEKIMRALGLKYLHVSFKHIHPEDEDVAAFLKVASDPADQPVFVHCRNGVDRTGMMVAVYRMVVQDWPKQKAIAEMKKMGFNEIHERIEDYVEKADVAALRAKVQQAKPPDIEVGP